MKAALVCFFVLLATPAWSTEEPVKCVPPGGGWLCYGGGAFRPCSPPPCAEIPWALRPDPEEIDAKARVGSEEWCVLRRQQIQHACYLHNHATRQPPCPGEAWTERQLELDGMCR